MACDLTRGRLIPCKDSVGGLRAVYFIDYDDVTITRDATDSSLIDTLGTTVTNYKYDLKGNSSYEETINASRETGTVFFEQTLNLTFTKLRKEDHKEIKLLAYARPRVIVEDYNGNLFVMGLEHGAEVSGGTIATGAAMGDLSGYTLTLSAQELEPANFIVKDDAEETVATTLTNAGLSAATQES